MCNNNRANIQVKKNIPNTSVNTSNAKPVKRQWSKWLSNTIAIGLANANETSKLNKSYWNTYHCTNVIRFDEDAKGTATYCKNRWCYTCNRIRTARLINGYLPSLQKFDDAYFVTLTRKTCNAEDLPNRLTEMAESWKKITNSCRVKYAPLKGTAQEYKGIKKLECTIRPNGKYHPHYHLLVNSKEQADYILSRWLKMHNDADAKAQDIRKADDRSHKELFKYFTKINQGKRQKGQALSLDYKRLDIVFCAMKGQVVYRAFGQLRMIKEDFEDTDLQATTQLTDEYANRLFSWVEQDWICMASGEMLIGKDIPTKVTALIPPTIEVKEAIEQTNYLPPLTTFASLNDAFDLDETPINYYTKEPTKPEPTKPKTIVAKQLAMTL